jgi:hypothetical protein
MHATYLAHSLVTFSEEYNVLTSYLCNSLQPPVTLSLSSKYSPQHPDLKHRQYVFLLVAT